MNLDLRSGALFVPSHITHPVGIFATSPDHITMIPVNPIIAVPGIELSAIFETVLAHMDLNARKVTEFSEQKLNNLSALDQ